jgi:SOS-response transcriptional repressor LexA
MTTGTKSAVDSKQRARKQIQQQTFALRTHAPEMSPRFWDGEIALFDKAYVPEPGDDVVVKFSDGRCTVRHLVAADESTVTLETYSPKTSIVVNRSAISQLYVVVGRCAASAWDWIVSQEQ